VDLAGFAIERFMGFLLVLFRVSGIFVITPVLGGSEVPWRIRVLASVALSFAIYPMLRPTAVAMPTDWPHLVVGMAGELAVGMICGFVVNIVFVAAQMGGALLSRHMGTALAQVMNPLFESSVPVLGQFYYMFALVVFVGVNGHHILIAGLVRTFDRIPLMGAGFHAGMVTTISGLMGDMFMLMIRLAAPTFVALFLVTVALGIIARTVPQIHVLIIGFPLKVCLGLVVTSLALAGAASLLAETFVWIMGRLEVVLQFMAVK